MRRPRPFAAALAAGLMTALLTSCASQDKPSADQPPVTGQDALAAFQNAPGGQDDVAASTQSHADLLAEALARSQGSRPMPDANATRPSQTPATDAVPDPVSPTAAQVLAQWLEQLPAPATKPTELSRQELFDRLMADFRKDQQEPLDRALAGVLLSAADLGRPLDAQLLAGLDPSQRLRVQQYHQVVQLMRQELARGDNALARDSLEKQLAAIFGEQPIQIRHIELCRQVSGYGIYTPFDSNRFLAGQPQWVVIYIELDNFKVHDLPNGEKQVKLEQEVVLRNEADGLVVWRHDPVQIVDTSRNRRRDFFVTHPITLPSRVSVGQYHLTVRVTDMHGGSVGEATTQLQFVADEQLRRER